MAFTAKVADLIAEDKTGLLAKHESWKRVPLSEVAGILNGAPFDSAKFSTTGGLPLARIRDVIAGKTSTHYTGEYDDAYVLAQGDLLVGMDGDFNTGYWGPQVALLNQRVCKLTPNPEFYDKALLGYVLPAYLIAINVNTPSITVKHLSSKTISEIELPLPPRAEQTRIVEKLEELLSDLDAGVAELKAAQKKLAQCRQSLLKAAVEGALTADWRAARAMYNETLSSSSPRRRESSDFDLQPTTQKRKAPDSRLRGNDEQKQDTQQHETGADLLQRILAERRARWEQKQLAKFSAQGKPPPKDWKNKYSEPVAPDTRVLPALPEGWAWSSLGQCFHVAVGATPSRKQPKYWNGRISWVSSGEVRFSRITETKEKITESGLENTSTQINPIGSVLLGMIGEGKTRGQVAILDIEAANNQNCAAIWASESGVSPEFVYYWLWSRYEETRRGSSGNNQPALNKSIVENIPFPLPPPGEITVIVAAVEAALSEVARQGAAIDHSLTQSTAQRKNLLKAAFSGQLVPQDPNDESASALLARIRAARVANTEKRPRKTGRKSVKESR